MTCAHDLDEKYPDWRYKMPPGSTVLHREGEQILTNAVPTGADIVVCAVETTSSQMAVIHSVSLRGDQLEDSSVYVGKQYVPLAPTAIRGKLRWYIKSGESSAIDAKSYGTPTPVGFQRLMTLNVGHGLDPIIVPPRSKIELVIHPIDPTVGADIAPDGAYLHGCLSGYFVRV